MPFNDHPDSPLGQEHRSKPVTGYDAPSGTPSGSPASALEDSPGGSPLNAPEGVPANAHSGAQHDPALIPTPNERCSEAAILLLYLFFFLLWCAGYVLGLFETETRMLFGLPLWFCVSCLFAFAAVCLLLYVIGKRYFR